ncbi:MAG: shikimate kinase [Acidimicrobiales bacterium]
MCQRVFLVGMMGSGKSTVGGLLAAELGWEAVDTDELVERGAGMSVAEMFAHHGEELFRQAEAVAVQGVGKLSGPTVVSVGGGAVSKRSNRDAMRALGTVVWLRARPDTLLARLGAGEGRPLLSGRAGQGARPAGQGARPAGGESGGAGRASGNKGDEPAGVVDVVCRLCAERAPLYQEVADLVVDVDDCSPEDVAAAVLAELAKRGPC